MLFISLVKSDWVKDFMHYCKLDAREESEQNSDVSCLIATSSKLDKKNVFQMNAVLLGYFLLKFLDFFSTIFLLLRQRLKRIPTKSVLYDGLVLMSGKKNFNLFLSAVLFLMFFSLVCREIHALLASH